MIGFSHSHLHEDLRAQIVDMARQKHVPNTLLFSGVDGGSALSVALSLAKFMACDSPKISDSCNSCPSCIQFEHFNYPDLNLTFPFVKSKSTNKEPNCLEFRTLFTSELIKSPFLTAERWLLALDVDNQQTSITVGEAKSISQTLSLKAYQNKPRFIIIWQPEQFHVNTANKLLKIIEEPGENVYIFLVSHQPKSILKTILSRCVSLKIPPQGYDEIKDTLLKNGLSDQQASYLLPTTGGSLGKAEDVITSIERCNLVAEILVNWLRILYSNDLNKIIDWSETMAQRNREEIKYFFDYSLQIIRQAFLTNHSALSSQSFEYQNFQLSRFSPFIDSQNLTKILSILELCKRDISRNSHQKTTVLDASLQLSKYIG